MGKYLRVIALIFRQRLQAIIEYRANFSIRIIAGFISFLFLVSVWHSLRPNDFKTIFWLFYVLVGLVGAFSGESFYRAMGSDIYSGQLSFYLVQPLPYILRMGARLLADSLVNILIMTVVILISGFFLKGVVDLQSSYLLLAIPFLILGRLISILLSFLAGCVSFVWLNPDAFYLVLDNLLFVLYGSLVPFWVFPKSWQTAILLLPFRSVIASPVEIALAKTESLFPFLFSAAVWLILLSVISRSIWKKVLIYYEAVGG